MGLVDFFKNVNLGYLVVTYVVATIVGYVCLYPPFAPLFSSLSLVALLLLVLGIFVYLTALCSALIKIDLKPWSERKKLLWRVGLIVGLFFSFSFFLVIIYYLLYERGTKRETK
jgi:hypothetical protein